MDAVVLKAELLEVGENFEVLYPFNLVELWLWARVPRLRL